MASQSTPDIEFDLRRSPDAEFKRGQSAQLVVLVVGTDRRLVGVYLPEPRSISLFVESFSGYGSNEDVLAGSPRIDWRLYGGDRDCEPRNLLASASTYLVSLDRQGLIFQVTGMVATDYRLDAQLVRTTGQSQLTTRITLRTTPWLGSGVPTVSVGPVIG